MAYTPKEIGAFQQKDKRISWLSIFSSLNNNKNNKDIDITEQAFLINDELYKKYPFEEETPEASDKIKGIQVEDLPF